MVRLVRTSDGKIAVDIKGKMEGRGTYLCKDKACWEKALKNRQLEYALNIKIKPENLEQLSEVGKELLKESTVA